jgi:hypothetical protein
MIHSDVRSEVQHMSIVDRLDLIEWALALIRRDLDQVARPEAGSSLRERLAAAAAQLRDDYASDDDLTAFTALDAEDFHAAG